MMESEKKAKDLKNQLEELKKFTRIYESLDKQQTKQGLLQYGCHGCLDTCKNFPTGAWNPSWEKIKVQGTQFLQKNNE